MPERRLREPEKPLAKAIKYVSAAVLFLWYLSLGLFAGDYIGKQRTITQPGDTSATEAWSWIFVFTVLLMLIFIVITAFFIYTIASGAVARWAGNAQLSDYHDMFYHYGSIASIIAAAIFTGGTWAYIGWTYAHCVYFNFCSDPGSGGIKHTMFQAVFAIAIIASVVWVVQVILSAVILARPHTPYTGVSDE